MKILSNYQTGERAKGKHNGLSAFCGLNCWLNFNLTYFNEFFPYMNYFKSYKSKNFGCLKGKAASKTCEIRMVFG